MQKTTFGLSFLFVLVMGLVTNAVYMAWFASKGQRYTFEDGVRDRAASIAAHHALDVRITRLESMCLPEHPTEEKHP